MQYTVQTEPGYIQDLNRRRFLFYREVICETNTVL